MVKSVSRRDFLNLLAATGGSAAILSAGTARQMLPGSASAATLDLLHLGRNPRKVAILGGGISGLTVAYELSRRGYDCTILKPPTAAEDVS